MSDVSKFSSYVVTTPRSPVVSKVSAYVITRTGTAVTKLSAYAVMTIPPATAKKRRAVNINFAASS